MQYKVFVRYTIGFSLLLLLAGCAKHYTDATYENPYGFLSGILHGLLCPIAIFVNVFSWLVSFIGVDIFKDLQIIGRPNTGLFFYYIGYFLGLSFWAGADASSDE